MTGIPEARAPRVVLVPLATPLPLGFLGLVLATVPFAALQLGWVLPTEGRVAALTAIAATLPLQLLASGMAFRARDPVVATGMGVLAGTWAVVGLVTLSSPPGATSRELGIVLITAGLCMLVPALSASAKLVPGAVMGLAAVRFAVTGGYELSGSSGWKIAAGWVGLALGLLALYASLALAIEGTRGATVLPLGRRRDVDVALDPGLRPQL
jgi:succinate-acetate transporter protein